MESLQHISVIQKLSALSELRLVQTLSPLLSPVTVSSDQTAPSANIPVKAGQKGKENYY
jgi:hypothetical protein